MMMQELRMVPATAEWQAKVEELRIARTAAREAKDHADKLASEIRAWLGVNAADGVADLCRLKCVTYWRVDIAKLRKDYPEIARAYLVSATYERVDIL
jgi:hypothetical protein